MIERVTRAPIHYVFLHAFPASIWSILVPFQQAARFRVNYVRVHRLCGYITLLCSFSLGISGVLFPMRGLAYTPNDRWELHRLDLNQETFPVLAPMLRTWVRWPTAEISVYVLPIPLLFTGWQTIAAISGWRLLGGFSDANGKGGAYRTTRSVTQHQLWASAHTVAGYTIHLQRVWQVLQMAGAHLLYRFSLASAAGIPDAFAAVTKEGWKRITHLEQAAFAATIWLALISSAVWWVCVWRAAGRPQMRWI